MADIAGYIERVDSFLFAIESGVSSSIGRFLFEKGISRPIAIKVNDLVEELASGPIDRGFFDRPEVIEVLRSELSSIAFNELMEHLQP
jgi:hypothetical protein